MSLITFEIKELHIHVELKGLDEKADKILKEILTSKTEIMAKLTDLEAQVDAQSEQIAALQTTLDTEQGQIQTAIDGLSTTISNQTAQIADLAAQLAELGASQEIIDRVVGKLTANTDALSAIKTDLEGTIADAPTEPPVTPEA